MIVFHGNRFYGKVHHVPGLCYIATRFYYIQFVPFFPMESYLFIDDGGSRGVKIPMHGGSVLMGYLRAGLIIGAAIALIAALVNLSNPMNDGEGFFYLALAPIAIAVFWLTYRLNRVRHEDAHAVLIRAGLERDFVDGLLSPPSLPSADELDGFAPGRYQTESSPVRPRAAQDYPDVRENPNGQGITSKNSSLNSEGERFTRETRDQ